MVVVVVTVDMLLLMLMSELDCELFEKNELFENVSGILLEVPLIMNVGVDVFIRLLLPLLFVGVFEPLILEIHSIIGSKN